MNINNPLDQQEPEEKLPSEIEVLKTRATAMGITYSNNIGVESLRKKINDKMEGKSDSDEPAPAATVTPANPLSDTPANAPVRSLRQHLKAQAEKLVRIRISCMDPKKNDLPGEFFTVANEYIGTIRKYVPFGEVTDNGYHVPQCIYEFLKSREFLAIQTKTHPVTKQIETKTRYVKEFAIEVLPSLTAEELEKLAADQRATGRLEDRD